MAVTADDSRLYVTSPNLLGSLNGSTIAIINTESNTVVDTLTPGGGAPFFIYAAPIESATASTSFILGSTDGLADTGQPLGWFYLMAIISIVGGSVAFRRLLTSQP
jgi:hypothetical protein